MLLLLLQLSFYFVNSQRNLYFINGKHAGLSGERPMQGNDGAQSDGGRHEPEQAEAKTGMMKVGRADVLHGRLPRPRRIPFAKKMLCMLCFRTQVPKAVLPLVTFSSQPTTTHPSVQL